jgi:hypothetical protein
LGSTFKIVDGEEMRLEKDALNPAGVLDLEVILDLYIRSASIASLRGHHRMRNIAGANDYWGFSPTRPGDFPHPDDASVRSSNAMPSNC